MKMSGLSRALVYLLLAGLLAGCGSKAPVEKVPQKEVAGATGPGDSKAENGTEQTADGPRNAQMDVAVAAEFKGFPVPPGFRPQTGSYSVELPQGKNFIQAWQGGAMAPAQVIEFYAKELPPKGFKETSRVVDEDNGNALIEFKGEKQILMVTAEKDGDKTTMGMNLTVTSKP